MELSYYPGCTLKTTARNFETTALAVLELFDMQARELPEWYCCGVNFSQVQDNLMLQLAPLRTLMRAKQTGSRQLLTLCAMCYNTLRRAQQFIGEDEARRATINDFMDHEGGDFTGDEVEIIDILTLLKQIGPDKLQARITRPVSLQVAPYYGCLLLRPRTVAIDDPNNPQIMENLLSAVGCQPVAYPFRTDCCASYQIVNEPQIVHSQTKKIVTSAVQHGAELLVVLCPLCHYNLDAVQAEIARAERTFKTVPVLYFTQLLALIFGLPAALNDFGTHRIDPVPTLKAKGLL